ncbi:MAG: oligoendopeptidase F [Spirochaetales bacterium]|nr:oligoendopeptidase F [Spirochaetales bacterium]
MLTKKKITHSEIPTELTWDLTKIYLSDDEWKKDFDSVKDKLTLLLPFKGNLRTSASTLAEFLKADDEFSRLLEKLYTYSHLKSDEDTTNSHYQGILDQITGLIHTCRAELAWVVPEIIDIDDEIMNTFMKDPVLSGYTFYLEQLLRKKPHTLSPDEEKIMAMEGEIAEIPYKVFTMLNNADIRFPEVPDGHGEMIEMSHALYSKLLENSDREVRKKAFDAMYDTFGGFKNALSVTIDGAVKAEVINSRIRHYPSALGKSLFSDNIEKSVYENLISVINDHLPVFHRYVRLRKKVLNLDDLDMYDLYVPLVQEFDSKIPLEQAREWVIAATKPLGEEYSSIVQQAFSERWIDFLECRGKRSGAYSGGCYDTLPYILLNYNETLDSVFTLAHELGHSVHSYLSHKNQEFCYSDYSIFVAEVASTTNELLLTDYLLETTTDERFKVYLLNHLCDGFKGTVYRQTQFAEFEKIIYEKTEARIPLTVDELNRTYYDINKKYYGPAISHPDKKIEHEWARIPHFYYNFYVYKYATGFSAAVTLKENIMSREQEKISAYLGFLKAGSSRYPLDILKSAGVDLTTSAPIETGLKKFEEVLDKLEQLL